MIVVCKEAWQQPQLPWPEDDLSILYLLESLSFASPFAGLFFHRYRCPSLSRFFFSFPKHSFPMHFFTVFTVFAAVSLATFIVPRTTQPSDWPDFLEVPFVFLYVYIHLILSISHGKHIMLDIYLSVARRIANLIFLLIVAIH